MDPDNQLIPTKLLWIDLEMTGLDPNKDLILEVAAEITDFNFKTIASYESIVSQPHETVVKLMSENIFWKKFPDNREEFLNKMSGGKPSKEVEADLIDLVAKHMGREPVVLAGNSIHSDREFIRKYWPELELKLHYRMLDVSAFKVLMQARYDVIYEKNEIHRAFEDIQASIAELQYYLDWFGNNHGKKG